MIKWMLLAAVIFSVLFVYVGLIFIIVGYDFIDYFGDYGNCNLVYVELVVKVENVMLFFNFFQGCCDYEIEYFNVICGQGVVWYKWNNWLII